MRNGVWTILVVVIVSVGVEGFADNCGFTQGYWAPDGFPMNVCSACETEHIEVAGECVPSTIGPDVECTLSGSYECKPGCSVQWYTGWTNCYPGCQDDSECGQDQRCDIPGGQQFGNCVPIGGSPIILSLHGNNFILTGDEDGVYFDLNADGVAERTAWTSPGYNQAFLVLDRNGNGFIDDGTELFGNFTAQPSSDDPNGFLALAVFDLPEEGGNGDGSVTAQDSIFADLALWVDVNHDGVSQPNELTYLFESDIIGIDLNYRLSPRIDQHGNRFRYVSTVFYVPGNGNPLRRFAVDVIFRNQP